MGGRLFTDKLVCGRLKVLGVWSLDSATPFPSAYPAHASGSPGENYRGFVHGLAWILTVAWDYVTSGGHDESDVERLAWAYADQMMSQ